MPFSSFPHLRKVARSEAKTLASDHYPELEQVLVDRPPPNSHQAKGVDGLCALCNAEPGTQEVNGTTVGDRCAEHLMGVPGAGTPAPEFGQAVYGSREVVGKLYVDKTAGILDWLNRKLGPLAPPQGGRWSFDWCRYRHNSHCFYPGGLDQQATSLGGYAVWTHQDRGECPRFTWEMQEACPIGAPGPNAGGVIDANSTRLSSLQDQDWEQVEYLGILGHAATYEDIGAGSDSLGGEGHTAGRLPHQHGDSQWEAAEYPLGSDRESGLVHPGMGTSEWASSSGLRSTSHLLPSEMHSDLSSGVDDDRRSREATWQSSDALQEGGTSLHAGEYQDPFNRNSFVQGVRSGGSPQRIDKDFAFHFIASWADVRAKAARIRREGGVRIIGAPDGRNPYITAEVKGDHNTYQTTILRSIGGKSVAGWECTCAWAHYAWGRSGRWKKFEGRQCSHALATIYQAQADEMFGGRIKEIERRPAHFEDPAAYQYKPPEQIVRGPNKSTWRTGMKLGSFSEERPIAMEVEARLEAGEHPNAVLSYLRESGAPWPEYILTEAIQKPFIARDPAHELHTIVHLEGEEAVTDAGERIPVEHLTHPDFDWHSGLEPPAQLQMKSAKVVEDPTPHLNADGSPHSGVMVALVPPKKVREGLAVEDGEPPEDMHVTVGYLGHKDGVDPEALHRAVGAFAKEAPPLRGKVSGFGNFEVDPERNDGNTHAHVGLVDIPGISGFREKLSEHLGREGLHIDDEHGLEPHLTVAYGHEPAEYDSMPDTTDHFDLPHVTVSHGSTWTHYPLEGSSKSASREGMLRWGRGRWDPGEVIAPHNKPQGVENWDATHWEKLPEQEQERQAEKPLAEHGLDHETMVQNVLKAHEHANEDPEQYHKDADWYEDQHHAIKEIARSSHEGRPKGQGTANWTRSVFGAAASLSPNTLWHHNLNLAGYMAHNYHKYNHIDDPKEASESLWRDAKSEGLRSYSPEKDRDEGLQGPGFDNMAKAMHMLRGHGDPHHVLGGHKVRSFFNNLVDPKGEQRHGDSVTTDRHHFGVLAGAYLGSDAAMRIFGENTRTGTNTKGSYALTASATREAHRRLHEGGQIPEDWTPSHLQAGVWGPHRREAEQAFNAQKGYRRRVIKDPNTPTPEGRRLPLIESALGDIPNDPSTIDPEWDPFEDEPDPDLDPKGNEAYWAVHDLKEKVEEAKRKERQHKTSMKRWAAGDNCWICHNPIGPTEETGDTGQEHLYCQSRLTEGTTQIHPELAGQHRTLQNLLENSGKGVAAPVHEVMPDEGRAPYDTAHDVFQNSKPLVYPRRPRFPFNKLNMLHWAAAEGFESPHIHTVQLDSLDGDYTQRDEPKFQVHCRTCNYKSIPMAYDQGIEHKREHEQSRGEPLPYGPKSRSQPLVPKPAYPSDYSEPMGDTREYHASPLEADQMLRHMPHKMNMLHWAAVQDSAVSEDVDPGTADAMDEASTVQKAYNDQAEAAQDDWYFNQPNNTKPFADNSANVPTYMSALPHGASMVRWGTDLDTNFVPISHDEAILHDEPEGALPSTDGGAPSEDWQSQHSTTAADPISAGPAGFGSPLDPGYAHEDLGYPEADEAVLRPSGGPGAGSFMNKMEDQFTSLDATGSLDPGAGDLFGAEHRAWLLKGDSPRSAGGDQGIRDSDIAAMARQFLTSGELPEGSGPQTKVAAKVFTPAEQQELITEGADGTRASNLDRLQLEGTHYQANEDEDDLDGLFDA